MKAPLFSRNLSKAACPSVYTYKLTSYMSLCLWAVLQENIEKSMDYKLRRDPDTRAHGCESRIDPK